MTEQDLEKLARDTIGKLWREFELASIGSDCRRHWMQPLITALRLAARSGLTAPKPEASDPVNNIVELKEYEGWMKASGYPTNLMVSSNDYPEAFDVWYRALDVVAEKVCGQSMGNFFDGSEEIPTPEQAISGMFTVLSNALYDGGLHDHEMTTKGLTAIARELVDLRKLVKPSTSEAKAEMSGEDFTRTLFFAVSGDYRKIRVTHPNPQCSDLFIQTALPDASSLVEAIKLQVAISLNVYLGRHGVRPQVDIVPPQLLASKLRDEVNRLTAERDAARTDYAAVCKKLATSQAMPPTIPAPSPSDRCGRCGEERHRHANRSGSSYLDDSVGLVYSAAHDCSAFVGPQPAVVQLPSKMNDATLASAISKCMDKCTDCGFLERHAIHWLGNLNEIDTWAGKHAHRFQPPPTPTQPAASKLDEGRVGT